MNTWVKVIDKVTGEMVAFGLYEDCKYYGTEDYYYELIQRVRNDSLFLMRRLSLCARTGTPRA